jgi:CheY-like chemotaxis protein
MSATILLIDSNPAVQAIASLALSQLEINLQTLASRKFALAKIQEIKPDLVLFAHDDEQAAESFKLCSQLRQDNELESVAFILMVRAETAKAISKEAKSVGVTELLKKPFKSDQLKNTVERVLGLGSASAENGGEVLIILTNPLTQKVLRTILEKRNIGLSICESLGEAHAILEHKSFAATLFEPSTIDNANNFSWVKPEQMGTVFAITNEGEELENIPAETPIRVIKRPLSFAAIQDALDFLIGEQIDYGARQADEPLEPEEQAILAARISASVFELLLNQRALRARNWKSAGTLARDELMRVCAQFDALASRLKA